jgi:hypothetical protein
MRRIALSAAALLLAWAPAGYARDLIVDLAEQDPGSTETRATELGDDLVIVIRNIVPGVTYNVTVERLVIPITALDPPQQNLAPPPNDCTTPETFFEQEIRTKTTEDEVRDLVNEYRNKTVTCPPNAQQVLEAKIQTLAVRTIPGSFELTRGEKLVVTTVRADNGTTWTTEFSTGDRGEWRTSYGFNFLPSENDTYFLNEESKIQKNADRRNFDFAPSIFYSWMPREALLSNVRIGPVAGLGFDLDNPIVFGGVAITYNQNISLNLGAVMHKQTRLLGKYHEDQKLDETLDATQLVEESYSLNYFVGLSFRFSSNPFSGGDDDTEDGDED